MAEQTAEEKAAADKAKAEKGKATGTQGAAPVAAKAVPIGGSHTHFEGAGDDAKTTTTEGAEADEHRSKIGVR